MNEIFERLVAQYPDAKPELVYTTPFELLIATILAAQCTDVRVNLVTKTLFQDHNTPEKMLNLSLEELMVFIKPCGLFASKAKNILATCKILVEEYASSVPDTMEALVTLPGVGRKTANVVLANAFGKDAFAVDTHVFRLCHRLGFTNAKTPESVEKEMCEIIPKGMLNPVHHALIYHGRRVCSAKKPKCSDCVVQELCPRVGLES